jgi:diphthamide synthase (EF-2-diphthine--ammonia ligase)
MAFGDLFLEDIRAYRERQLAGTGLAPRFPIWGLETGALAREMVAAGLRAHVTCVDPRQLDPAFAGRTFGAAFLDDLPEGVDPCGENGEFHTFAWAGPMFDAPLSVVAGPVVERDGFQFADLLPGDARGA